MDVGMGVDMGVGAGTDMDAEAATTERIRAVGKAIEGDVVAWRRLFHRHPEVAWEERWTQATLREQLEGLGVPCRALADTGLVATIRGQAPDAYDAAGTPFRRVALRADIDALPVAEETGAEFASEVPGRMHACGHDCHMAMMLGAARILTEVRDDLRGEVRILFQPAEEVADGSRRMIREGALEGVDAIYGQHIWSDVDAGLVSCEPGKRMANTDWFRIEVEGASSHGAQPHEGIDAVVVGAHIVCALQTVASRSVSPFEPVVVTVGEFHAGTARNVLAGSAVLTGTIRTWDDGLRAEVPRRVERIARQVAEAMGARAAFSFEAGNRALENDPACAEVCRRAVVKVLGEGAVARYQGTLSGEDFSEYLQAVPGVFAFIGTRNPAVGAMRPQHSCRYTVDESVLVKGSMVAAQWACDMLAAR